MISRVSRLSMVLAISLPLNTRDANLDAVDKKWKVPENKDETGWDRVKRIFKTDEYGRISNELNSIHQAGFLGMFTGAVYGGFLGSRKAYFDFLDRNQATAFVSHLDAKRKLQNQVTVGFAKNAFRFGWRLAWFTTSYTAISTTIAVYRGKSSMLEYVAAGAITGSTYKFNLGLRGMAAGMIVGGGLGTIAGCFSLLLLRSTGMTMEEVRYWQYKWRSHRDDAINDSIKFQIKKDPERHDPMMEHHDQKPEVAAAYLDIKALDETETKTFEAPEVSQSKK